MVKSPSSLEDAPIYVPSIITLQPMSGSPVSSSLYLKKLLVFVGVFQLCVYLSLIYFLIPKMNVLWISENIAKIVDRNKNDVDEILN